MFISVDVYYETVFPIVLRIGENPGTQIETIASAYYVTVNSREYAFLVSGFV